MQNFLSTRMEKWSYVETVVLEKLPWLRWDIQGVWIWISCGLLFAQYRKCNNVCVYFMMSHKEWCQEYDIFSVHIDFSPKEVWTALCVVDLIEAMLIFYCGFAIFMLVIANMLCFIHFYDGVGTLMFSYFLNFQHAYSCRQFYWIHVISIDHLAQ